MRLKRGPTDATADPPSRRSTKAHFDRRPCPKKAVTVCHTATVAASATLGGKRLEGFQRQTFDLTQRYTDRHMYRREHSDQTGYERYHSIPIGTSERVAIFGRLLSSFHFRSLAGGACCGCDIRAFTQRLGKDMLNTLNAFQMPLLSLLRRNRHHLIIEWHLTRYQTMRVFRCFFHVDIEIYSHRCVQTKLEGQQERYEERLKRFIVVTRECGAPALLL